MLALLGVVPYRVRRNQEELRQKCEGVLLHRLLKAAGHTDGLPIVILLGNPCEAAGEYVQSPRSRGPIAGCRYGLGPPNQGNQR